MKDYGWTMFAATITAVAVDFLFTSTELAPGGTTGLSLVCSTVFGIPVSTASPCISIPLLTLSIIIPGKGFGIGTLYITLATPLPMKLIPLIRITQLLLGIHSLLELMIVSLLGELLAGATIGITLDHVYATGGTDVIALSIQYAFKFLKVNVILLFLGGSVVIASGVIAQNALISVFSFPPLTIIVWTISFVTKHRLSA